MPTCYPKKTLNLNVIYSHSYIMNRLWSQLAVDFNTFVMNSIENRSVRRSVLHLWGGSRQLRAHKVAREAGMTGMYVQH